jgi:predicted transcriptional regulator
MDNPNYTTDFFNVLKNQTRLWVFQTIISGKGTIAKIHQELKSIGAKTSQYSISDDYIQPLITIGLVTESLGKYSATQFGICINDLLVDFDEFIEKLPSQSECHEEHLLQLLLSGPKTRKDIRQIISSIVASRVLKRLATSNLVNLPADRNYIFFHKSKRDPALEKLTNSEMNIYQAIPTEGITADKLAKLVGISQRRIYNHIRHLKGKKLVFTRNIPLTYTLTNNGQKLATILQNLSQQVEKTWSYTECISQHQQQTKHIYSTTTSYMR